jgi:protein-disulfide isomerase
LGIVFFIATTVVYELSRVREWFSSLFGLMIFGASGAEIAFIFIQKYRIQKWCPLCLGIATAVYFVAMVITVEGVKNLISKINDRRTLFMSVLRRVVAILIVFAVGFFAAFQGMQKGEAEDTIPNIFLGKQDSSVEVFIMTDWFCPACQQAEQEIERAALATEKKAKIIFVDVVIHPETLNYTPYNLSFLTYEKNRYMELRKALLSLTKKTKEPTPEDVQQAIAPLNITYKPLTFLAATKGMKYYDTLVKEFKVSSTPTVIVRDTKTKAIMQLVGTKEITQANIVKAVDTVAR